MALLLTEPYDPWKQTAWVGEALRLQASLKQHQEDVARQQQEQAAADQRRSFEFDRRLEFDRSKSAAEENRTNALLAISQADNAPFTVPQGVAASANLPSLPTAAPAASTSIPTGAAPASPSATAAGLDMSDTPAAGIPDPSGAAAVLPAMATPPADDEAPAFELDPISGAPHMVRGGKLNNGVVVSPDGSTAAPAGAPAPTPASAANALPRPSSEAANLSLMPAGAVPSTPKPTASSQVANMAAEMAKYGVPSKRAKSELADAITSTFTKSATAATADKPNVRNFPDGSLRQYDAGTGTWVKLADKPQPQTLEEAVGDATYNKLLGTYTRPDGSEFFLNQGANGRYTQRAFRPGSEKPAKLLWGDNGKVYPHDAQGNPLKPVPDGVQLRDHATLQTANVPGVGRVVINADQSTRVLIPEGIGMTAKQKNDYTDASAEFREAQVDLDAKTALLAERPRSYTNWFGGSESSVEAAKARLASAQAKVEGFRKDFPQLAPKSQASPAATTGAIPTISSKADFDALPSGSIYFGEGGKKFKKP